MGIWNLVSVWCVLDGVVRCLLLNLPCTAAEENLSARANHICQQVMHITTWSRGTLWT
jgi:hypothetical protein